MQMKCGVAGVGYLGSHHARIYSEIEKCQLMGVFDIQKEKAQSIAQRYNCRTFDSLEALGEACDAVSVATPTTTHSEVALKLLEKNCHLLIEKPFCTHLGEAEKVIQLAQEKGCYLQVGHVEHYNPVMSYLEVNVNLPRYITTDRLAPFSPRCTDVGIVLDLMIHDLGIVLQLVRSPIVDIEAIGVSVLSSSEDIANARIRFKNGCIANFNASRVSLKKVREIRIFQPNKYLSLDFIEQKGHFLFKEGQELKKEIVPLEKKEPLKVELESFVDCLIEAKQPKVGGSLGFSALEVALKITEIIKRNAVS